MNDTAKKVLQDKHTELKAAIDRAKAELEDRRLAVRNQETNLANLEGQSRDIVAELQLADTPETGQTRQHSVMDEATRRT